VRPSWFSTQVVTVCKDDVGKPFGFAGTQGTSQVDVAVGAGQAGVALGAAGMIQDALRKGTSVQLKLR